MEVWVQFFKDGFFGYAEKGNFKYYSIAHFVPLILMVLAICLIWRYRDRLREWKHEENCRFWLAFIMLLAEMSYFWRLVGVPELNPNPVDHLPITVCGWVVVFSSYMVIGKSQTLFDISYFWAFSGSVFALITPTVISYTGPTRFRYYQFWLEHTLGYVAIFYMIFVHRMRPNLKSMVKAYGALAVLAVVAYIANTMLGPGANYLFMAKPEDTPSILDILPPNFALRLLIMAAAVTALFFVAYLPWFLKDRKAKRKTQVIA